MHALAHKLFLTSVAAMTLAAPASSLLYAQDDGPPKGTRRSARIP